MICTKHIKYNITKHLMTNTCKFVSLVTAIGVVACYGLCYLNRQREARKGSMQTKSETGPFLVRTGFTGWYK